MPKQTHEAFCRNEYNVTGICSQSTCPLANSRYATVREHDGVIYLYIKTIERAHSPKNLWEKIELSHTYTGALAQLDDHLQHWPAPQVHKIKQRLTRLHQYLIRMRKISTMPVKKLSAERTKNHTREVGREYKALVAAKIDFAIKKELLERLKSRTYGDLYNLDERIFNQVLDKEGENDVEFVEAAEGDTEEQELEDIEDFDANDADELEEEEEGEEEEEDELELELEGEGEGESGLVHDIKSLEKKLVQRLKRKPTKPNKKGGPAGKKLKSVAHVEIEYENETENATTTSSANW